MTDMENQKGRYKDPNYMKKFMKESRKIDLEQKNDYKRVKRWLVDLFEIVYQRADVFMNSAIAAGKPITDQELQVLESLNGYKEAGLLVPVPVKEVRVMKKGKSKRGEQS